MPIPTLPASFTINLFDIDGLFGKDGKFVIIIFCILQSLAATVPPDSWRNVNLTYSGVAESETEYVNVSVPEGAEVWLLVVQVVPSGLVCNNTDDARLTAFAYAIPDIVPDHPAGIIGNPPPI